MNISDTSMINYTNNVSSTSGNVGAGKYSGSEVMVKDANGNNVVIDAKEGAIMDGKILDITGGQATIELDSGATMLARLTDGVSLRAGESLSFAVKENAGGQVAITPITTGSAAMDNTIFKALEANNVAPTEKNYEIAKSLIDNNMPVNNETMRQVMKASYNNPSAPVSDIVSLTKMGVPVTESNLNEFAAMRDGTHQMTNALSNLENDVMNLVGEMNQSFPETATATEILNANFAITDIFTEDVADDIQSETSLEMISELVEEISEEGKNPDALKEAANKSVEDSTKAENSELAKANGETNNAQTVSFKPENVEQFKELLRLNTDNPDKLLKDATDFLKANPEMFSAEELKEILSSNEYKNLLSGTIKKKFSMDGENMNDPKEIDDFYEGLYNKTNKLMHAFQSMNTGSSTSQDNMNQSAKTVQERIDFMQQLNNGFAYAQIPVSIKNKEMNSELFVYMNKKQKASAKDAVSAMLHLDMDHLGATDVHVSLHGDTVTTRFYVDDEESARIIDEHMTILEKAINEIGYSLNNEVNCRDTGINRSNNKVTDEIVGGEMEKSVKRYTFDIRM